MNQDRKPFTGYNKLMVRSLSVLLSKVVGGVQPQESYDLKSISEARALTAQLSFELYSDTDNYDAEFSKNNQDIKELKGRINKLTGLLNDEFEVRFQNPSASYVDGANRHKVESVVVINVPAGRWSAAHRQEKIDKASTIIPKIIKEMGFSQAPIPEVLGESKQVISIASVLQTRDTQFICNGNAAFEEVKKNFLRAAAFSDNSVFAPNELKVVKCRDKVGSDGIHYITGEVVPNVSEHHDQKAINDKVKWLYAQANTL